MNIGLLNSKKLYIAISIACLSLLIFTIVKAKAQDAKVAANIKTLEQPLFVAGEVLVKYLSDRGKFTAQEVFDTPVEKLRIDNSDQNNPAIDKTEKDKVMRKVKELMLDDKVATAQPNYIYATQAWTVDSEIAKPGDYSDTDNWNYTLSHLPEMWKAQGCPDDPACGGSADVMVAVIDTGLAFEVFDDSAPGLTDADYIAADEYDDINLFVNADETPNNGLDDDCNGVVDDYHGLDTYAVTEVGTATCDEDGPLVVTQDYYKAGHPVDTYHHGSVVTGAIAGEIDNSDAVSPAFNVTIMPIASNIHFTNSFTTESLIIAIDYAAFYGADIINMSLGSAASDALMHTAIQDAYDAGIMIVAASGNVGTSTPIYPAAHPEVVAVGSVNPDDTRSAYSSYGDHIDLAAYVGGTGLAGGSVYQITLSCGPTCTNANINSGITGRYRIGTSLAAPQVTALAALIKSTHPEYNRDEILEIMYRSARDIGDAGVDDYFGYGVIDFEAGLVTDIEQSTSLYRFWSEIYRSHFYTISETEKSKLINTDPNWDYEKIGYYTFPLDQCTLGKSQVFRFWSPVFKSHFYTMSTTERDKLINTDPNWDYEKVAFCAYSSPVIGSKPVYRFWSDRYDSHFYTISESEKNKLLTNPAFSSEWRYEKVSYYAFEDPQ